MLTCENVIAKLCTGILGVTIQYDFISHAVMIINYWGDITFELCLLTLYWACWGTPRAIPGYSFHFRPPNLPAFAWRAWRAVGDISAEVFSISISQILNSALRSLMETATSIQGKATLWWWWWQHCILPLALRAGANYIQARDADVSCTAWLCTTWHRHSHVSPTCHTDAGSGLPPLNNLTFRPAVGQWSEVVPFLLQCRSKGVEKSAKRHYIGLVAVGVQEQAEVILVLPLLQNCLTLNDISLFFLFSFSCNCPWTVVLALVLTV